MMELLIVLGAIVALDILAQTHPYDSTELGMLVHHDRALDAAGRGELDLYRLEIARMERGIRDDAWLP